jgi:hypothetical protein
MHNCGGWHALAAAAQSNWVQADTITVIAKQPKQKVTQKQQQLKMHVP